MANSMSQVHIKTNFIMVTGRTVGFPLLFSKRMLNLGFVMNSLVLESSE